MSKFECDLLSTLWLKLLTMILETNLVITVRDATLDVASDNIDYLMKHIQLICEQWGIILQEAKLVAQNEGNSTDFSLSRYLSTQPEAEQHYKVKVFTTIIDSILSGLQCRFNSLKHICTKFGCLWQFNTLSNEGLSSLADQFCERYSKHISRKLFEELIFLKCIYSTNFKLASKPHYLFQKMLELGFLSIFSNACVGLRIFLTLAVSVATAERSFSIVY